MFNKFCYRYRYKNTCKRCRKKLIDSIATNSEIIQPQSNLELYIYK